MDKVQKLSDSKNTEKWKSKFVHYFWYTPPIRGIAGNSGFCNNCEISELLTYSFRIPICIT
jgi:hypothetical protein